MSGDKIHLAGKRGCTFSRAMDADRTTSDTEELTCSVCAAIAKKHLILSKGDRAHILATLRELEKEGDTHEVVMTSLGYAEVWLEGEDRFSASMYGRTIATEDTDL